MLAFLLFRSFLVFLQTRFPFLSNRYTLDRWGLNADGSLLHATGKTLFAAKSRKNCLHCPIEPVQIPLETITSLAGLPRKASGGIIPPISKR
jgi:hypothetical protein